MRLICNKLFRSVIKSFIVFAVVMLTPGLVSAYYVAYDYYVYAMAEAPGNTPITTTTQVMLDGTSSTSGAFSQSGTGTYAAVQYYADLATGKLGAYAYASGTDDYTATGRVKNIQFTDYLTFVVPSGTYTNDVTVTLSGMVSGSLESSLYAGAQAKYYVQFNDWDDRLIEISVFTGGEITVNDFFSIPQTLVSAGTTLTSPLEKRIHLTGRLNHVWTWTIGETTGRPGPYSADAEVDFFNTLSFTNLSVPEGVTWTSDSGVFLTAASVPEPATLLFLGLSLLGVAVGRKKIKNCTPVPTFNQINSVG